MPEDNGMKANLKTQAFGQPNNTYRNRLKDITVLVNNFWQRTRTPYIWLEGAACGPIPRSEGGTETEADSTVAYAAMKPVDADLSEHRI